MLRQSSFVKDTSCARTASEKKYYIAFAVALFVCGVLFLILPPLDVNGILIMVSSWVLVAVLALALLRPLLFSRGVADVAMAIITGAYYGVLEMSLGTTVNSIADYRLMISIALFIAGLSRIFVYARMIEIINLPLLLISGFSEMLSAFLIFFGWPSESAPMIYWYIGMTMIISGFDNLNEAGKLNVEINRK